MVLDTTTAVPWSNEPTGITYDPAGGRLWISDDVRDSIYELDLGPDGVFGTNDDERERLRGYVDAGCNDLEDVTYNVLDGRLYAVSGFAQEICRIDAGPDGIFDGAAQWGDDELVTFSLVDFGITDPEGIVHDPLWDTLVVADRGTRRLYELTTDGVLLRQIEADFPGGAKLSGVTIAPGSSNPALRNYWVTDRGVDNNVDPFAVDGKIYEVVAIPLGGNAPPVVNAGPDRTLIWPVDSVALAGFVSDDGHPYPPSSVLVLWSPLEGPASVSFEDASSPETTVWFPGPGHYVLQLLGDDSALQTTDVVTVDVLDMATLSLTTVGFGSLVADPPGESHPAGETITLTAVPSSGTVFGGWSGDATGTANPLLLVMDGDKAVQARFNAKTGGCGIGPELAVALPLLSRLRRRRRR